MKICKRIKATVLSLCLIIGMCAASLPQTVRAEYGDNAYAFMKQLALTLVVDVRWITP